MSFLGEISNARQHATSATRLLDRVYGDPTTTTNRGYVDAARDHIAPGATRSGSAALDAARWDRWVGVAQIRDTGRALQALDAAWWRLGSMPDLDGARRALHDAVNLLDRAATRSWYRAAA